MTATLEEATHSFYEALNAMLGGNVSPMLALAHDRHDLSDHHASMRPEPTVHRTFECRLTERVASAPAGF